MGWAKTGGAVGVYLRQQPTRVLGGHGGGQRGKLRAQLRGDGSHALGAGARE